ncbi:hypothetical protein V5T82_08495 [Magnetovibrio sp. PR-2]|uniref:hypothetical protein n=1 Tax=Magnetovibrio sp. PR-2 TaxID=3120356 RepID=UPI002FCE2B65
MKRLSALFASLFAFAAVLATTPAQATLLGDDSHIQLKHIMAQVQGKKGAITNPIRPLTPILTVPNGEHVAFVCQRSPRAAEAILYYFSKYPAPLDKKRRVDLDALKKQKDRIAGFVNKALGRAVVSEVYVIEGGKSMGRGVMSRLPFAQTQGCGRVLEEYEDRMQQLLGGEKKGGH